MQFIHYFDVWGNDVDGFDVNDVSRHKMEGNVPDTEEQVFELLVENGWMIDGNSDNIRLEFDESGIEISRAKTGYPLGRIEF